MLSNLSLSQKGIFVLTMTLLIQVVFLNSLAMMQKNAVHEIEEGLQIEATVRDLTEVSNLWSRLATSSFRAIVHKDSSEPLPLLEYKDQFAREFADIGRLLSRQTDRDEIAALQSETENAISMLGRLKRAWESNDIAAQRECMTEIGLVADASTSRSNKLIDRFLIEQQQNDLSQSKNQQSWWLALVVGLFLNFGLVIAAAYLFIKEVADKYAVITENSVRMAEGQALLPPLPGLDEISVLDREFHRMANTIVAAHIKERAVSDNALDLICSLSAEAVFINVNPAAQSLLGYNPSELLGKSYFEIVVADDKERITRIVGDIAGGAEVVPFEHSAARKDGSIIAVQVSAHWSQSDRTLFFVVHDLTQYHRVEMMKRQFTDAVTLSLRSPLISTRETVQSLLSVSDDERTLPAIRQANVEIEPIRKLIFDLLELERIDAAMLTLDFRKVPLQPIIAEAVGRARAGTVDKNIDFSVVPDQSVIECDDSRLLQAVSILLNELIRKSEASTTVLITCRVDELVHIDVLYKGSPLTLEEQEQLFGALEDAPEQLSLESTSLSLIICRTLIEAHQGAIGISGGEPGGNALWIQFPVSQ